MVVTVQKAQTGAANPIIQKAAQEDPVPWYKKPNLRSLYLMLFPTCMGIELTSGFDSQLINALQIVPSWQACEFIYPLEMALAVAKTFRLQSSATSQTMNSLANSRAS